MSCQSAPGRYSFFECGQGHRCLMIPYCPRARGQYGAPGNAPSAFFIGFFEFGQGHRGLMIPYCPGAP
ncbi:unnamed protein product, partial [Staurois parvus]